MKTIKDENGNDVEVYSKEEIETLKSDATNAALNPLREKMGLKDDDDFNTAFEESQKKAKERVDWEKVKGGKEKTKTKAQDEILAQLKEKGIEAELNAEGQVVVNGEKQNNANNGITAEEAQAAANKAVADNEFNKSRDSLIGNLDEGKRADVRTQMESLQAAGVAGDVNQLFNMSMAALGVDAPTNMNTGNPMGGYPNGFPNQSDGGKNKAAGDFADTAKGQKIMSLMGVPEGMIKRGGELKDSPRVLSEGRVSNEGGHVANQFEVLK